MPQRALRGGPGRRGPPGPARAWERARPWAVGVVASSSAHAGRLRVGPRSVVVSGDPNALGAALFNRLQPVAVHLAPVVETVYRRLAGLNPAGCLMSGSGSAVYALCRDAHEANRVASAFRATRPPAEPESRVMVVRTLETSG